MEKFIDQIANQYDISTEKHNYSIVSGTDWIIRNQEINNINFYFLQYVLFNSNIDKKLRTEILEAKNSGFENFLKEEIDKLIVIIGLEKLEELVKNYNKIILQQIEEEKTRNSRQNIKR